MSTTATSLPIQLPSLDSSVGSFFIGVILSTALWGVGVSQCYSYYLRYTADSVWLKIWVAVVLALNTGHQAVICQILYYYTITNFFNPLALAQHIPSLQTFALLATLTFASVQLFFTYRIWGLSRHERYQWLLIILPILLILAALAVTLAYFILVTNVGETQSTDGRHPIAATINGLCAAGDILIAAIMTWLLYSKRTGFSQSDGVIKKLMVYTVQNGGITSAAALVTLVIALAVPGITYSCFYHITSKLYLNTMLSSLNARNRLSGMNTPSVSVMTRSGQNFHPTMKNESTERDAQNEDGSGTDSGNPLASAGAASAQETEPSARNSAMQTELMTGKSSDMIISPSASPERAVEV